MLDTLQQVFFSPKTRQSLLRIKMKFFVTHTILINAIRLLYQCIIYEQRNL